MGVFFFFLLFYGGVELFCDILKSAVVVGEIVLLPVLVPVLVPVEFVSSARMPSSRTWFLATWRRRKTAWTPSWRMNALALVVMLSRNTGAVFPGTSGMLANRHDHACLEVCVDHSGSSPEG